MMMTEKMQRARAVRHPGVRGQSRRRSISLGRSCVLTLVWWLVWPASGCLIFTDFSRSSEEDAAVSETPPPVRGSCDSGEFVCLVGVEDQPDRWSECDEAGEWVEPAACSQQMPYCNAEVRGCVGCRAGTGRCEGTRFIECGDEGTERFIADCAVNDQICDFESSGLGCIDCLPGQTRCGASGLLVCNSEFVFESQPCVEEAGCITHPMEPGRRDYCAECSIPGGHYCQGERHYRCNAQYGRELVEDCASIGSDCISLSDAGATCE